MDEGQGSLEGLVMDPEFWQGKRVLVTGHTGFKGSWLALWLNQLGASVSGYALNPPTTPSLYIEACLSEVMKSDSRADINNFERLKSEFESVKPEVVFHLAAQSLVREGYKDPLRTLNSNIMGTAHVLEAARDIDSVQAIVLITSDKVYENKETNHAYSEGDRLGGLDPYSASKAASEMIAVCYRNSFFSGNNRVVVNVATARAGNVIGGGDWANDRLVPDCLRAFSQGEAVELRFPNAVRPWQHVLEPLAGYIQLAEKLCGERGGAYARAWNFGPLKDSEATVANLVSKLTDMWGAEERLEEQTDCEQPHEAGILKLNSSDAHKELDWTPSWTLDDALLHTVNWQQAWLAGEDVRSLTLAQIDLYQKARAS